jgi:uncharacterized membrane protein YphA (DoxX/SURF4 family)
LAIVGGYLVLYVSGAGRYALDRLWQRGTVASREPHPE